MPASDSVRYQFRRCRSADRRSLGRSTRWSDPVHRVGRCATSSATSSLEATPSARCSPVGTHRFRRTRRRCRGDDLEAVWSAARAAFVDGLDSDGALDRMIDLPFGTVPAEVLVAMLKFRRARPLPRPRPGHGPGLRPARRRCRGGPYDRRRFGRRSPRGRCDGAPCRCPRGGKPDRRALRLLRSSDLTGPWPDYSQAFISNQATKERNQ